MAPIAEIRQRAGTDGAIEIISAPGIPYSKLARPGSCLVVRAEQAGELVVILTARRPGGSIDASFRLESVTSVEELENWKNILTAEMSPGRFAGKHGSVLVPGDARTPVGVNMKVLAHLARRGDVIVGDDEWVGGPTTPAPIEGLEFNLVGGADVQIETQVFVGVRQPVWTDWVGQGGFVGTRGRGLFVSGVRMKLRGRDAVMFELSAEGLFLGSLVTARRGSEVEMVNMAGDPLVGLKVSLRRVEKTEAPSLSAISSRERAPRVRVFRASAAAGA